MDNILCYESDESTDNNDTNPLATNETENVVNLHLSLTKSEDKTCTIVRNKHPAGEQIHGTCGNVASNAHNQSNFFNLSDEGSSSNEEEIEESRKTAESSEIEKEAIINKNISAVNQQFWRDNTCIDPWTEPEKLWKIDVRNENKSDHTIFSVEKSGTVHNCDTHKRSFNECNLKVAKYKSKKQKIFKDAIPEESLNKDDKCMSQHNLNLKSIYHIHHKIGPFINDSNHRCKTPRKVLMKFNNQSGTLNKIEWCSPQYSHLLLSASMDKTVKVWDVFAKDNVCLRILSSHSKAVKYACWSRNGREILSCSYDKSAVVSDVETGKVVTRCEHDHFVSVAKYHPVNFHYFVTGTYNKLVCWDLRNTIRPVKNFLYKDTFGQVQDIAFLKDGGELISCSDLVCRDSADRNIMVWDFQKGVALSNQIYQEKYTCTSLKVHPTESEFIAQTQGNYIALFSSIRPYRMNKFKRYQGHKVVGYNIGCDFSKDGRLIVTGSSDGQVLFYDYEYARQVHKMNFGKNTICLDVAWHPLLYSTVAVSTWEGDIMILQ